jgi:hypothetical protein
VKRLKRTWAKGKVYVSSNEISRCATQELHQWLLWKIAKHYHFYSLNCSVEYLHVVFLCLHHWQYIWSIALWKHWLIYLSMHLLCQWWWCWLLAWWFCECEWVCMYVGLRPWNEGETEIEIWPKMLVLLSVCYQIVKLTIANKSSPYNLLLEIFPQGGL